jgi:hypothetical protein
VVPPREEALTESVLIENPILNSPYREPSRHFRFDEDGITSEIADGRRPSSYFVPIASPRKKGAQQALDTQWTSDRLGHAYFTDGDKPYERLKKTLRAEMGQLAARLRRITM